MVDCRGGWRVMLLWGAACAAAVSVRAEPPGTDIAGSTHSSASSARAPVLGPDLVLWLDAQDLRRTVSATDADAPTPIAEWPDRSQYGHHARQPEVDRRPTLARDAAGDALDAVHFSTGRRQWLSAGNARSLDLTQVSIFVVARASRSSGDMWLLSKNHWGPPWTGYGIAVSHDGLHPWPHLGLESGARGYFHARGSLGLGFRIVSLVYDGRTAAACLDARPDNRQDVAGAIVANREPLTIGTLGGQYLEGDIAEMLVYRKALDEAGQRQVHGYLVEKYGLPENLARPDDPPLVRDWLFQADGHPLARRIAEEIGWARSLAARLDKLDRQTTSGSRFAAELAELDSLAALLAGKSSSKSTVALRDLYLAVRRVKRAIALKNPLVDFTQILCIDQPYPQGSEWQHQAIHRLGHRAVPGGRLLVLQGFSPDSAVRTLGPVEPGSYWRPDLSFDGRRVLFCYKAAGEKSFHLYETAIDGGAIRRLTDGDYDDIDPIYLPDGHILFTTTRANTYVRCGPYIYSYTLARCNPDGTEVYLISQNSEPDFVPSLLPDGRVIYSRWEYTDKSVFRVQSLWTTNPDGTDTMTFWGNQSVWPDHQAEPRAIPDSRRVMFAAVGHHDWFTGSIGIIDPRKGFNYPHGLTKVTRDVPWPEVGDGPAETAEAADYHAAGAYTSYKTPFPLSEEDFLVSARGTDDKFRLYLMDSHGNRELLFEGLHNVWHAMPVRSIVPPPQVPDRVAWPGTGPQRKPAQPGVLFSADIYQGVPDLPRGSVKYIRVVESDPKTYSTWFKTFRLSGPPVSVVFEDSVKRFLGTAPVHADGSFAAVVPPGRALSFQLLDEKKRCVQTMRSFTGVMPDERRGCVGCHESHSAAPPHSTALALRQPPRELTPPPWGDDTISFPRFVQPVLDRHCGKCHQGDGEGRRTLDLTSRPAASVFTEPYLTLVGAAGWNNPATDSKQPGYGIAGAIPVETMDDSKLEPKGLATLRPGTTLSAASPLIEHVTNGKHHGVRLEGADLERLMAWIDANCPYMGDAEIRALPDPDFPGIAELPIRPRVRTAPVIPRP
jgi:hypothetical protein